MILLRDIRRRLLATVWSFGGGLPWRRITIILELQMLTWSLFTYVFPILSRCYLVWGRSWKVVVLPLILLCGLVGEPRFFLCSCTGNRRLMAVLDQSPALVRPTTLPEDATSTVPSIVPLRSGTDFCSVSRSPRTLQLPLSSR